MRDHLLDIVKNTYGLGIIDLVKVSGTDAETNIEAIAEDRSVIVKAKLNTPVTEFNGTFGMPNLGKLSTILGISEYAKDAKITLTKQDRNGESVPVGLHFENAAGDFKNDYRFMTQQIVEDKLKTVTMRQVNWNIEFTPSVNNIQRLKFMASANAEELNFTAKTEGTDLKLFFGDHSSHAGDFVFQAGVTGTLTKAWAWPVAAVSSILSLSGDKTFRISDEGAAQITVNSGLATYDYILPAQSK
jgi:hypothetical protein|tara:strand:- start:1319 stop:2050 length:732 start_codon:yes stop_codon:yes gene_type:complete